MNKRDIRLLYDTVNSFYVDRKRTLKYITVNGYDILYDNKIVFLGTLTPETTKPADGEALMLVWTNFNTLALRCKWKDAKLVEDSLIRVRALQKPFWQLNIPECLSSVSVGKGEKEPFWELGWPVFYEGSLKNWENEGECYFYHDYATKNIAKYQKFENGRKVRLLMTKDIHPILLEKLSKVFINSKEFFKNGQPKFAFDLQKNKFTEYFQDGSVSSEVRILGSRYSEQKTYYLSGTLKEFQSKGNKKYQKIEYYKNENHRYKEELVGKFSIEEIQNMFTKRMPVHYLTKTWYSENGKVKRVIEKYANRMYSEYKYYSEIGKDSESEDKKILFFK